MVRFPLPLTAALLALALAPAGASAARTTCSSGKTVFTTGGARIFDVKRHHSEKNSTYHNIYACATRKGPLWAITSNDPFTSFTIKGFRLCGPRLAFTTATYGFSSGHDIWVGWTDLSTREVHQGPINSDDEVDTCKPCLPPDTVRMAIANDGTVAVLAG